jgi:hypothetical protein
MLNGGERLGLEEVWILDGVGTSVGDERLDQRVGFRTLGLSIPMLSFKPRPGEPVFAFRRASPLNRFGADLRRGDWRRSGNRGCRVAWRPEPSLAVFEGLDALGLVSGVVVHWDRNQGQEL